MRRTRITIVVTVLLLLSIGIVMIYSSSAIYAHEKYKNGMFFLKRHLSFVSLGIVLAFLAMSFDYRKLRKWAKPILILAYLLLTLLLIPGIGTEVAGARRWFRFGMFSFQPSELANISLIIYVADFIARKRNLVKDDFSHGFLPPLFAMGLLLALIIIQPDLGTCFALGTVILLMLFIGGIRKEYLLGLILLAIPVVYLLIFQVAYRRARILAFLNPWADARGSGFQIIQSNIAIGSGGIFGVGLGHSMQKLFYLPAAHTDFIFSIIGEEMGLLGTIGICLAFIILIIQGMRVARNAQDVFGYFLSVGIILLLAIKAAINIGVSIGALPTKGLPLPFISYGGSSLIFDLIGVGLLLNIARFEEE